MGRKRKAEGEEGAEGAEETKEAPVTREAPTEENPSGITAVSEETARAAGQLRGFGGPGAAGATVAGPIVHAATEGGTKPLPTDEASEGKPAPNNAGL